MVSPLSPHYLQAYAQYAATPEGDAPGLSTADLQHEAEIEAAFDRMVTAPDVDERHVWCDRMMELIRQRSPEAVASMEAARYAAVFLAPPA